MIAEPDVSRVENVAPMHVIHYLCTNVGMTGVETFVLQLAAAQRRSGLVPEICGELLGREALADAANTQGIVVHALPTLEEIPWIRGAPQRLRTAQLRAARVAALVQLLRARPGCVLHLHAVGIVGFDAFIAAGLMTALGARLPQLIVTHHATLSWFGPVRRPLDRATFALEKRLAARVVMPYRAAATELVAHGMPAAKTRVIPFCVDEKRFVPGPGRRFPDGPFWLVIVSRLVERKGHRELIQALAALRDRLPQLRLRIVGDGPERPALEAEIAQRGLLDCIVIQGWVAHDRVPALLQEADAIVLPTYMPGETFPLSLMEGMAVGLPAIGARWFGIPDIITHGETGLIVEPRDVDELARAIEQLASSRERYERASTLAIERVRDCFTATAVARQYRELYREAGDER